MSHSAGETPTFMVVDLLLQLLIIITELMAKFTVCKEYPARSGNFLPEKDAELEFLLRGPRINLPLEGKVSVDL